MEFLCLPYWVETKLILCNVHFSFMNINERKKIEKMKNVLENAPRCDAIKTPIFKYVYSSSLTRFDRLSTCRPSYSNGSVAFTSKPISLDKSLAMAEPTSDKQIIWMKLNLWFGIIFCSLFFFSPAPSSGLTRFYFFYLTVFLSHFWINFTHIDGNIFTFFCWINFIQNSPLLHEYI